MSALKHVLALTLVGAVTLVAGCTGTPDAPARPEPAAASGERAKERVKSPAPATVPDEAPEPPTLLTDFRDVALELPDGLAVDPAAVAAPGAYVFAGGVATGSLSFFGEASALPGVTLELLVEPLLDVDATGAPAAAWLILRATVAGPGVVGPDAICRVRAVAGPTAITATHAHCDGLRDPYVGPLGDAYRWEWAVVDGLLHERRAATAFEWDWVDTAAPEDLWFALVNSLYVERVFTPADGALDLLETRPESDLEPPSGAWPMATSRGLRAEDIGVVPAFLDMSYCQDPEYLEQGGLCDV